MSPKSRTKQLLVLLLGGIGLAFGGCLLFLTQLQSNSIAATGGSIVGAILFVCGLVMLVVGVVSLFVVVLRKLFGWGTPPPAAPPPSEPTSPV